MATMKDYSDIPGERDVFVRAWKIIEKHRHTPVDAAHLPELEQVAMECMELSQCADQYGSAAHILAFGMAQALYDYYTERCKGIA